MKHSTHFLSALSVMRQMSTSLSAKLGLVLFAALLVTFALLGYLNIRLHRKDLESSEMLSAERVSDVIKRSTSYYMLRNDREGLYQIMRTIADEPGMVRIRIFNKEGGIRFSTDPTEVHRHVDKTAEACYACHAQAKPLERLDRPDRLRIFRATNGERILGIINPIENSPSCYNAECHAHSSQQKILGVFDTHLSLARSDARIAEGTRQMLIHTLLAIAAILFLSGLFVLRMVYRPLRLLRVGTERLAGGDLGFQIEPGSQDEIGELARSFNRMSQQLQSANSEITEWARTLELRVDEKTQELRRAHEHAIHVEKMVSVGKLAAIVAHEINNPLAGILTYAKLIKKRTLPGDGADVGKGEVRAWLDLIETESRRCGEIVRNLLMYARAAPMNLDQVNLNTVLGRSLRLVQHQLDISGIQCRTELDSELPDIRCDAGQMEQVCLALIVNAIEAMPSGGTLVLRSEYVPNERAVRICVQDDGVGIQPEILTNLFEPFFTTKEGAHGTGLGLAVSRGIVERHGGRIQVHSQPGSGTRFEVLMPAEVTPPGYSEHLSAAPAAEAR